MRDGEGRGPSKGSDGFGVDVTMRVRVRMNEETVVRVEILLEVERDAEKRLAR